MNHPVIGTKYEDVEYYFLFLYISYQSEQQSRSSYKIAMSLFQYISALHNGKNERNIHICTIQGASKESLQTLRGDREHHKDSELRRNPCHQTSS